MAMLFFSPQIHSDLLKISNCCVRYRVDVDGIFTVQNSDSRVGLAINISVLRSRLTNYSTNRVFGKIFSIIFFFSFLNFALFEIIT